MIRKLLPTLTIAALSLAMLDIHASQAASQTFDKIKEAVEYQKKAVEVTTDPPYRKELEKTLAEYTAKLP